MRRIGIIQAHSKSFDGGDGIVLKNVEGSLSIERVIERLLEIKILDEIVIAVPDVPDNVVFEEIATRRGVRCFRGNKDDVASRLLDCAREYKADIIVRVLGNNIIFNPTQMWEMLRILEEKKLEAVFLSNEVFLGSGCVFTSQALERVYKILHNLDVDESFLARPMGYMRLNPDKFKMNFVEPELPPEKEVQKAREILREALCSGGVTDVDLKQADERDFSIKKYKLAARYLLPTHTVLDVACAYGFGSYLLSEHCGRVMGVDLSEYAINHASEKNKKDNIEYRLGDATKLEFLPSESCDRVVSFETIEHIEDDRTFVREISRVLKPEGLLILGTPRKVGDMVINPYHVREYSKSELESLLFSEGFFIEKYYSHTSYVISEADGGEGFVWVCRKNPSN